MKKDDLPVVISSMKDVPLGPIVERLMREFDKSEKIRLAVISVVFSTSAYPLSEEETREIIGDSTELRQFPSATWHREMQAGYLDLVDLMVAKLDRKVEPVTSFEDFERVTKVDGMITSWQQSHEFRKAIRDLVRAITQALWWFNLQLMNNWVGRAYGLRKMPYCDDIFQDESFGRQNDLIDSHCYYRAGIMVNSLVGSAYKAMLQAAAPQSLKDLFKITREEATKIAAFRMGHLREEELETEAQAEPEPEVPPSTEEDEPSPWTTTQSGIIIPSNMEGE